MAGHRWGFQRQHLAGCRERPRQSRWCGADQGGNCCPALKDATGSARCWAHGCERGVQPRLGLTYYQKAEQNAVPSIAPACEGDTKEFGPEREKGAERESRAGPQCSLRKLPQRWAADTQAISQGVVRK